MYFLESIFEENFFLSYCSASFYLQKNHYWRQSCTWTSWIYLNTEIRLLKNRIRHRCQLILWYVLGSYFLKQLRLSNQKQSPRGPFIYGVHKKWPIFWSPYLHHPQKWTIDLMFKNNRIRKHMTNFKTPPSSFQVNVINIWSLIGFLINAALLNFYFILHYYLLFVKKFIFRVIIFQWIRYSNVFIRFLV